MSFVSNSPETIPDTESLTRNMEICILPEWVHKAFTSKYSLAEIKDYKKLREILPLEDIAHLEILRIHALKALSVEDMYDGLYLDSPVYPKYWYYDSVGKFDNNLSPTDLAEIRNSVNLLVGTPSVVNEALGRLKELPRSCGKEIAQDLGCSSSNPATELAEKIPCRVIAVNLTLYIIVEEGFLSYLEKAAGRLAFLSQVLKAAYAVFPVRMVNSSMWYQQYLRALAA